MTATVHEKCGNCVYLGGAEQPVGNGICRETGEPTTAEHWCAAWKAKKTCETCAHFLVRRKGAKPNRWTDSRCKLERRYTGRGDSCRKHQSWSIGE